MSKNTSKRQITIDTSRRIVQIIPAQPGWEVVYADNEQSGGVVKAPVVCWALVESGGGPGGVRHVVGMNAEHGAHQLFYAEWGTFLGYSYPECDIDWQEAAKAYREL